MKFTTANRPEYEALEDRKRDLLRELYLTDDKMTRLWNDAVKKVENYIAVNKCGTGEELSKACDGFFSASSFGCMAEAARVAREEHNAYTECSFPKLNKRMVKKTRYFAEVDENGDVISSVKPVTTTIAEYYFVK